MNIALIFLYVITISILRSNGVEEREWKLSREDVREIERQIQTQKNNTVKSIRTRYGDIYDCVNFYKQPSLDNPLLKNRDFTPEFQKKSTFSYGKARNKHSSIISAKIGLRGGGCPIGSVPIKRHTKEDLIRIKIASISRTLANGMSTYAATCQAPEYHDGVSAGMAVYNPAYVGSEQYTAARMKLIMGSDSIEAGWRVDPKLYGDNKTHLYIRTDIRDIHCFNDLCSGFVITNTDIPLGYVLDEISTPQQIYGIHISIISDPSDGIGNWILRVGLDNIKVGYWPEYLFEKPGAADYVQWGEEVSGPVDSVKPGMGSGNIVTEDTRKDAFFDNVKVTVRGKFFDPTNVTCDSDIRNYDARSRGNVGDDWQFLIFYGGVRTID